MSMLMLLMLSPCSLALMGGFVFLLLRPFLAETANETRRIAELLSQLPAEVGPLQQPCPLPAAASLVVCVQQVVIRMQHVDCRGLI
jgi:hypothetical protein